jgi:predicted nucleic acid-binding protein
MPTGKSVYWDADVFLSWLKNEPRKAGVAEGMEQHVRLIDEGKIILVTSVISMIEVLDAGDEKAISQFYSLFDRPNVLAIAVDETVAKLSAEIRRKHKLQTPDAIHLASALHYSAGEFHTFDGKLLGLGNTVIGRKLLICEPYSPELSFLNEHEEEEEPEDGV